MSLIGRETIVANAHWLPWLIECLKVKDVVAPAYHTAYGLLEISLRVLGTSFGSTKIGSICHLLECLGIQRLQVSKHTVRRPASLAVPGFNLPSTDSRNVRIGLHDVVEVLIGSIIDILALPEAEGIDEPSSVVSYVYVFSL